MHYSHAIVRVPPSTCAQGLTTSAPGAPDAVEARRQFEAYVRTLTGLGLAITILPEQATFSDSHFVEDTAVVGPEFALLANPGAPSRKGETSTIAPELACHRPLTRMGLDARMDGGMC